MRERFLVFVTTSRGNHEWLQQLFGSFDKGCFWSRVIDGLKGVKKSVINNAKNHCVSAISSNIRVFFCWRLLKRYRGLSDIHWIWEAPLIYYSFLWLESLLPKKDFSLMFSTKHSTLYISFYTAIRTYIQAMIYVESLLKSPAFHTNKRKILVLWLWNYVMMWMTW